MMSNKTLNEIAKISSLLKVSLTKFESDVLGRLPDKTYRTNSKNEIVEISLANCKIKSISPLLNLKQLQILYLRNNEIRDITNLHTLTNLRFIDLSNNLIQDVSPLKWLDKLVYVRLSENRIWDISPLFNQLRYGKLDFLGVDKNPLIYPPLETAKAGKKDIIRWFENTWKQANDKIEENLSTRAKVLDLGKTGLTDLSQIPRLFDCIHLEVLILSNEWSEYKENRWERVTSNNKGPANNIFYIPNDLLNLKILQVFICGGDWMVRRTWNRWRLTKFSLFSKLYNLKYLNVSNNLIKGTIKLDALKKIQILHLNNNEITSVNMKSSTSTLKEIYISNNKLKNLSFLNFYPSLKTVDVHSNRIKDLLDIKPLIKKLNIRDSKWEKGTINVAQNPLPNSVLGIIPQGKSAVLAYFNQDKAERQINLRPFKNNDVKLILVGNSNAGKSTLSHFLTTGVKRKNIPTTHWLRRATWQFTHTQKNYTVRIFDFGGQEYYHDTHYLFFTRQTAYILLWDKSSDNFNEIEIDQIQDDKAQKKVIIQNYPLRYWIDSIEYHTSRRNISTGEAQVKDLINEKNIEATSNVDIEVFAHNAIPAVNSTQGTIEEKPNILVVQNKVDTIEDLKFVEQESLKAEHSKIYDILSISVLSSRGMAHFREVLLELLEMLPITTQEFLGTWGAIKNELESKSSEHKNEMSFSAFKIYCNNIIKSIPEVRNATQEQLNDILFSDEDTRNFAQYLNNIGVLLYFPESSNLKNRIFINQDQIIDKIYKILFDLNESNGQFDLEYVSKALNKPSFDDECATILQLMMHFKIIFPHPSGKSAYIAPLYLPKKPMKAVELFLSAFNKPIYRFLFTGYIHKNIILEFFQTYGNKALRESDNENLYYYWRDGIVIKDEDSREIIMVKFFNGNSQNNKANIDIYCLNNSSDGSFLNTVVGELERITKERSAIKAVTLDGEQFIPLTTIHKAEEENNWMFVHNEKYYELAKFKNFLKNPIKMKKIFISYSKVDAHYLTKLENHLSVLKRNGTISTWNCRQLLAGEKWDGKIKKELEEANIIIFLVSDDFLATDYIWDIEIKRAIERENQDPGNVRVIPIIVRACYWEESPLGQYNTAPKKAQVIAGSDIDEAFRNVVTDIKTIL